MPTPGRNEKHDDFVRRCIPIVIRDGTAKDGKQARAICESIWEQSKRKGSMNDIFLPITVEFQDEENNGLRLARIQVFKRGKFKHPLFGSFTLGDDEFNSAIKNFNAGIPAREIVVNFQHASHHPDADVSKAAGWFGIGRKGTRMFANKRGLFVDALLTKKAQEFIENEEFLFSSAEFHDNFEDEKGKEHGFTVTGLALTNTPFLRNMDKNRLLSDRFEPKRESVYFTSDEDGQIRVHEMEEDVKQLQERFTTRPWDGSKSRFTLEQLMRAVPKAVARHARQVAKSEDRDVRKADLKLPFKEPDGTINVNGLRNALARLPQTQGLPQDVKDSAREEMRGLLDKFNESKSQMAPDYPDNAKIELIYEYMKKKQVFPLTEEQVKMLDLIQQKLGADSPEAALDRIDELVAVSTEKSEKPDNDNGVSEEIRGLVERNRKLEEANANLMREVEGLKAGIGLFTDEIQAIKEFRHDQKLKERDSKLSYLVEKGYILASEVERARRLWDVDEEAFNIYVEGLEAHDPRYAHLQTQRGTEANEPGKTSPKTAMEEIAVRAQELVDQGKFKKVSEAQDYIITNDDDLKSRYLAELNAR